MKTGYLFLYNMVQWGGWLMILFERITNLNTPMTPYCMMLVYIFQIFAMAEILHILIGLVHANIFSTTVQVLGRLQVLMFMSQYSVQNSWGLYPMVLAWTSVEIVRYLFLGLKVIGISSFPLTWLRYSLFYVLYPVGVFGEMWVLCDVLPVMDQPSYLATYIRCLLWIVYLPALAYQYMHMMGQRKAALAKGSKKE